MNFLHDWRLGRRRSPSVHRARAPRRSRLRRFEPLEQRHLLSVAPTLVAIPDVTLLAGAPLHVALDGFDQDGDALAYTAAVDGSGDLSTLIPQGNRSLRMSVENHGTMVLELFEDLVPNTTARIIELAGEGFYDGSIFHRVIEDFMIQGGSSDGVGIFGSGVTFDDEFHPDLQHTSSGTLSMANAGPDTNDSQFFITAEPTRWLDFKHSIFGFLTDGDAVRQSIAGVPTGTNDKPKTDVVLSSVEVVTDLENGVLRLSAPEGTTGEADVTVTVSDGLDGTAQRTFHVTIEPDPENSKPFLPSMEDVTVVAGEPLQITLNGVDAEGDPLTYTAGVTGNADLTASVSGNVLTLSAPEGSLSGHGRVTATVQDDQGGSHDEGFDVTLQGVNTAPTMAAIAAEVTVQAGAPLHIALDGFDADGHELSYTVSVSNEELTGGSLNTFVPEGNRSLRMSVEDYGQMVFELFEGRVPDATARIAQLAQTPREGQPPGTGFYDGLSFHRVMEGFMIQGGAVPESESGGSGITFDDQFHPDLQFTGPGVLGLANDGNDTNDSQFFITAAPARQLDFGYTIIGFLTEGDDVRQAIDAVPADENGQPEIDVVIDSVEVFTDLENGVLMLSAEEGTSGEADVTVTVTDSHGATGTPVTFHVIVVADSSNANPFLLPIDDLHTTAGTPAGFTIPATDLEGDAIYYSSLMFPLTRNVTVRTSHQDGSTVVTPRSGVVGVYNILAGVRVPNGSLWDTQAVPVFITPKAPAGIQLLSDTGTSSSDLLTNADNSQGNRLSFRVTGVVSGAEVTVLADGVAIGKAIASTTSVVVATDGTYPLSDGAHAITAVQSLRNQQVNARNRHETVDLTSQPSAALVITVDTVAPQFTSIPMDQAVAGRPYLYDVQTDDEARGQAVYGLASRPAGMTIDGANGVIRWTPSPWQAPAAPVVVVVADAAGNQSQQAFEVGIGDAVEVDFWQVSFELGSGGYRYAFRPVRNGRLTVEALFSQAAGDVDLALLNEAGQLIVSSATHTDNERIDVTAEAGRTYELLATGANPSVLFRVANLVVDDGSHLAVFGTDGDDQFEVLAGSPHRVVVNGVSYDDLDPAVIDTISIDGLGGTDQATIAATDAADAAALQPRAAQLAGPGYQVDATDVESIQLEGGGGDDTLELSDSPGDDTLVATPVYAGLMGDGFLVEATSFETVSASAGQGGQDVAKLYDSSGDDTFHAEPDWATLQSDQCFTRVDLFDQVHAFATAGGDDTAELVDSAGSDQFYASPTEAALSGDGFYNRAKFFEIVDARAGDGDDRAWLFDSSGNDTFVGTPTYGALSGAGFEMRTWLFDRVVAHACGGGRDVAMLYDSAGSDTLVATPTYAALSGDGFHSEADGFDAVHAYATAGGHDVARLFDSAADDSFYADPEHGAVFTTSYYNRAKFFEEVHAYATAGGTDVATLVGSPQDDLFFSDHQQGALYRTGAYYNRAKHFEEVYADAGEGQHNVAEMHGSAGDDVFEATPVYGELYGAGFYNRAENFQEIYAQAGSGQNDRAYLYDSALDDLLQAEGDRARLSNLVLGSLYEASGFDYVRASASVGNDSKDVASVLDYVLEWEGPWQDL